MIFDKDSLALMTKLQKETFLHYTYLNKRTGKYTLCCDDARFFNHSEDPNTICVDTEDDEEGLDVAVKDIQEGEELTCNYDSFDAEAFSKLRLSLTEVQSLEPIPV